MFDKAPSHQGQELAVSPAYPGKESKRDTSSSYRNFVPLQSPTTDVQRAPKDGNAMFEPSKALGSACVIVKCGAFNKWHLAWKEKDKPQMVHYLESHVAAVGKEQDVIGKSSFAPATVPSDYPYSWTA
ncbi:MAG: hypothetical protein LQ347_004654 [Umbilicaria vellea]|nr:MAG: hypothetical protein LQ347_004654 [Umbilicaria vellea]